MEFRFLVIAGDTRVWRGLRQKEKLRQGRGGGPCGPSGFSWAGGSEGEGPSGRPGPWQEGFCYLPGTWRVPCPQGGEGPGPGAAAQLVNGTLAGQGTYSPLRGGSEGVSWKCGGIGGLQARGRSETLRSQPGPSMPRNPVGTHLVGVAQDRGWGMARRRAQPHPC